MRVQKFFSPFIFLLLAAVIFFSPFLFHGKLPIPSDTIVGLYHPFRDLYAKEYPNGIPFKNFLITDPVRQQYPWRELAVDLLKKGQPPLWNPYVMAGYPLLGNQQSAPLYPLNLLFFLPAGKQGVLPFSFAWSILILLQPLLGGVFLYLYLKNLYLNNWASLLGAIVFAFSGFSIAWMEWGNILHVGLWLPLILLSIDKIILNFQRNSKFKIQKYIWPSVFVFSLSPSLLAGHLQILFYVFLLTIVYFLARWMQFGKKKNTLFLFILLSTLFLIITSIQWIPTLQLISESARGIDQANWQQPGWFIPWQHLIQFVAPDFFGNPTTLNYWGVWNYGEFIGYVGILPLLFALFAIFFRRDKKTFIFIFLLLLAFLFALPTGISAIPYVAQIPFLSTAQPTRLLFVIDFSLAILAALGFDYFIRQRRQVIYPIVITGSILAGLWIFVIFLGQSFGALEENLSVARNNLILPTALFVSAFILVGLLPHIARLRRFTLLTYIIIFARKYNASSLMLCIIVAVTVFDLIRFGWKFTPFTSEDYLFPQTKVIEFLQKQEGQFRIMTTDNRVLPPNFSTIYRLQSIDGYDPLYLRRYGELLAASERGEANISPPFGFNRIITPKNYESKIIDLLGVKYILSLSELQAPKLIKVFQEGQTRIYVNKHALPRAFFIKNIHEIRYPDRQEAMVILLHDTTDLRETAVVEFETPTNLKIKRVPFGEQSIGKADIDEYSANKIVIQTENDDDGFLVLTDSYYPTWKATIDDKRTQIFRTDYNFRGIFVPKGEHFIVFYNYLL